MSTGMTVNEVWDEIDLPQLQGFTDYWRAHPPVHVLVAAYMGFKAPDKPSAKPQQMDEATLAALMGQFTQAPRT